MNPPCPPFECSHFWGPSLVASLKDSSLHSSLRQPAFDLIEAIIVSDCAALVSLKLKTYTNSSDTEHSWDPFNDEDEVSASYQNRESKNCCWTSFNFQSELAAREFKGWRCIPMLWVDTFVHLCHSLLPISFSKAILWALSHISIALFDSSIDMRLPICDWLTSEAAEISSSFGWEVPRGSEDGGDGNESKNSVKASSMCLPLIRTLKRCAAHFFTSAEHQRHLNLFTWESKMAESLILLLVDPDHNLRQVNRIILEHVSNTRGLTPGLQFLCNNPESLSAVNMGLRYAIKQAQLDPNLKSFPDFHHLFFVVRKLLKEAIPSEKTKAASERGLGYSSLDGGFLQQPHSNRSSFGASDSMSPEVDSKLWNRFCCLLSESIWPFILKCLSEGKNYIHDRGSQMTCVRLLETLPVIFESIVAIQSPISENSVVRASVYSDFNWIFDLVEWGRSSLSVVLRHWKQYTASMINLLDGCHFFYQSDAVTDIQRMISCDVVAVNELKEQLLRWLTLSKKDFHVKGSHLLEEKNFPSESSYLGRKKLLAEEISLETSEDTITCTVDSVAPATLSERIKKDVIILSDDEDENTPLISSRETPKEEGGELHIPAQQQSPDLIVHEKVDLPPPCNDSKNQGAAPKNMSNKTLKYWKKLSSGNERSAYKRLASTVELQGGAERRGEVDTKDGKGSNQVHVNDKVEMADKALGDPPEEALNFAGFSRIVDKSSTSFPKRKVIQLQMPTGERSASYPNRLRADKRRHRPPKLDDWYRPILEFDYFSVAGLSSENENRATTLSHLKEVPLRFESPEHYVEIFRPLVLEEFKAQLHHSYVEASSSEDISCFCLRVLSVERIDDFHLVRGSPEESLASRGCSENDLILLTKENTHNSSHSLHALGKVERRELSNKGKSLILTFRFYLQSACPRLLRIRRLLIERSKWYINHITSLTPQLREFQVLSSISDIPLMPVILNPVNFSPTYDLPKVGLEKVAKPLHHSLKLSFNGNQLHAISMAIGNGVFTKANELSLIQGPPGTGKTRTIVAIISALLSLISSKSEDVSRTHNRSSRLDNNTSSSVNAAARQAAAIARAWQDAALAKQLIQKDKAHSGSTSHTSKGRILICAQSNAAVDELVARINCGIYGSDGKMCKPFLVRVGNVKTVHPSSLPFFIDTLVRQQLEHTNKADAIRSDVGESFSTVLRSKLEKIVDNIRLLESIRAKLRDPEMETETETRDSSEKRVPVVVDGIEIPDSSIGPKLNKLYAQKKAIYADLSAAQVSERKKLEETKLLRMKIRRSILREAQIVVTTLSGSGGDIYGVCSEDASDVKHSKLLEYALFDAVVIDEAAQALEPATLIPLQLLKSSGTKCIMVGDPKQLPATVLSNVASKFFYQCSMFERLQRAGYPVTMLTQQYRMHPDICRFPSLHFYDSKLVNGEMSRRSAPFHENKYFGPYIFYDIIDGQEHGGKGAGFLSLCNEAEAEAAVEILKDLKKRYPSVFTAGRIGVVTPYKKQLSVLRFRFSNEFGPDIIANMEFNTVDGFQGREVDILLLSTVRASAPNVRVSGIKPSNIGFVADARRMNVALTRAKLSLWILGNARTLQINAHWSSLIQDAKARDMFVSVAKPYGVNFRKLSSSLERSNLGENKHGSRFLNRQKSKSIEANVEKQSYRSGCEVAKEQGNAISSSMHASESKKTSSSLDNFSDGTTVSSQRVDEEKSPSTSFSTNRSTKAKASRSSEVSKSISSRTQLEKNPNNACLSGPSSQSRPGSNLQHEKIPDNDGQIGGIDATAMDVSLSRKRQQEAGNVIPSKKQHSSQRPVGIEAVKRNPVSSTTTKVHIRPPKRNSSKLPPKG